MLICQKTQICHLHTGSLLQAPHCNSKSLSWKWLVKALTCMVCAAKGASFPCGSVVKNLPGMQETNIGSVLGWGRSPGGGNGNALTVFLPGKSHGQRSLAGYSPWGLKELDTTEWLSNHSLTCNKEYKRISQYQIHPGFGKTASLLCGGSTDIRNDPLSERTFLEGCFFWSVFSLHWKG